MEWKREKMRLIFNGWIEFLLHYKFFFQSYKIDHICNIGNVLMSEKTMFLCCLSLS